MKDTARNRAWIERQFTRSSDVLLRSFSHYDELKLSTLVRLLVKHIKDRRVRIRYLKRGVSGAGVLLLIPEEGIAQVVKFGSRKQIISEHKNFKEHIEGRLPAHIAALTAGDKLVYVGNKWASLCYWWAGGEENVQQINELLSSSVIPSTALIDPLAELMKTVFRWSKPSKTANRPSELMRWRPGIKRRIQGALKQSSHPGAASLVRFLDGDCERFSKIGVLKFSVSKRCHGDINYRNVVFSGSWPSRFRLCLIDFGSLKGKMCLAYDWSKLERDIHFKCVCDLWHEPSTVARVLAAIDNCTVSGSLEPLDTLPVHVDRTRVQTIIALISSIRDEYIRLVTPFSDLPLTEYLWFLLYRWLTLLDTERYPNHDETTRTAVVTSAASIYEALQRSLADNSLSDVPARIVKAIAELDAPAIDSELNLSRSQLDQSCMAMAVKAAYESKSEDEKLHPRVGVVVVRHDGKVRTSYRGETGAGDHAEFGVLEKALRDESLANATVFTTLEPCTDRKHEGLTCAEHLVERRVARVVIGILNPNPKAAGKGMHLLQQAGIEVATFPKPFADELHDLNRRFQRSQNLAQAATEPRDGIEIQESAQSLDFIGAWYGVWRRPDGKSGRELIHVLTQQGNTIAGTFFNVASPEVPFVFEGIYRPPYLRVQFHSPYKDSQGKGIMEDGSCFLKVQDDGSFTGFYASFDDYGEYEFRRA